VKRRLDDAGSHCIESDVLFRVFRSQASQSCVQTTFSDHRKGSGYAGNWIVGQRSSDAHDAASGLLRLHLFNRKLRDMNEAIEVSRDESAKVVCRVLRKRFHKEDAGVRDDGIDRAELFDREFCNFLRRLKSTYVAIDQGEVLGSWKLLRFRRAPRGSYNIVAACEKRLDDARADALRCSRNDHCLLCICHLWASPFLRIWLPVWPASTLPQFRLFTFYFLILTSYFLLVPWVVFLRAVNVGGANRCQPALITKELSKFDIVNIGAVGTFVARENVSDSALRAAIAKKLPFKCEIMICPARDIIKLASKDPFSQQPSGPNIVRFVSVLAKRLRALPPLPLSLPLDDDWLLKIIAIQDRFVLGLYRRQMKAISYLSQIEKRLGVPATTRNWNTIEKVAKILRTG